MDNAIKLRHEPLVEAVGLMEYRSTISRDEISRLIEEPVGTSQFYSIIGKAKRKLIEQGRVLKAVPNQGYILLHPDDCIDEAVNYYKRGGRAISRGKRILDYIDQTALGDGARDRFKEVRTKAATIHAEVCGAVVGLNLLARPHPLELAQKTTGGFRH